MWYPLNSPLNHMKDHQKIELHTIGSVFGIVLLVNMYGWELTGLLIAPFLCHIGTTSALSIMKMFLLNLSKSKLKRATDDWYCISKIFPKPHNIQNSRFLWTFGE